MTGNDPNLIYVPLNEEYDRVSKIFKESYGSSDYCISALFRVHNPALESGFRACIADIEKGRGCVPTIRTMFHGTTMAAVPSISAHGFDPSFSRVAAYGRGTYASPSVGTALRYCKDVVCEDNFSMVFLCDFATGKHGAAKSGHAIDTAAMDYCGNNKDIFVTPYRYGIIPKYLICFYKWATQLVALGRTQFANPSS